MVKLVRSTGRFDEYSRYVEENIIIWSGYVVDDVDLKHSFNIDNNKKYLFPDEINNIVAYLNSNGNKRCELFDGDLNGSDEFYIELI